MNVPTLVLASASPRRRDLLAAHGYTFVAAPAAVEESAAGWLSARELVLLNAGSKSAARRGWRTDAVVLGVDTLVSLDGQTFGKPRDLADAARMLALLAGRTHEVYTGVCLDQTDTGRTVSFVEQTRVTFLPLGPREIADYHRLIDPLDKAGAYAAQEHGEKIIEAVDGSWSNVMGLPMERLSERLASEFSILPSRQDTSQPQKQGGAASSFAPRLREREISGGQ